MNNIGNGIDALFEGISEHLQETLKAGELHTVKIDCLVPNGDQPRKTFSPVHLEELSHSIKQNGILQPIIVRFLKDDVYEIIAGERRWRAAKQAKLSVVPVVVIECDKQQAVEIGLIENLQRKNLSALEEAESYQMLIDEFDLTQQEVAHKISKSRSYVANILRLLTLPETIQNYMRSDILSAGHARNLIGLDELSALQLANEVRDHKLSVRDFERKVKQQKKGQGEKVKSQDVETDAICSLLREKLNAAVTIKFSAKEQGKIEISFENLLHLDAILARIN